MGKASRSRRPPDCDDITITKITDVTTARMEAGDPESAALHAHRASLRPGAVRSTIVSGRGRIAGLGPCPGIGGHAPGGGAGRLASRLGSPPADRPGVLRKADVPPAAAVIGVKAPQMLRSAADVPDLHRAWLLAQAAGLVAVTDGKAIACSTALPDQDAEVLSGWLDALRASAAAEYGQRSVPDDILLSFLEVVAEDPADPRVQGWVQRRSACWTLLDAFGAVAGGPQVTPLGRWA